MPPSPPSPLPSPPPRRLPHAAPPSADEHERSVHEVVALLERYAAADHELTDALDRISAQALSSRRISQPTISHLENLLARSLVPGVHAKAELDALPHALRRAGIAAWASSATSRAGIVEIEIENVT